MPSPKSGKAGSVVSPTDPAKAEEADTADPGKVEEIKAEQRKTQTGKYGAVQTKPHKGPQTEQEKQVKKSWIAIELVDDEGNPVPGQPYRVTLPDGSVAQGTLDEKGWARVDGFEPGECNVEFPGFDGREWKQA